MLFDPKRLLKKQNLVFKLNKNFGIFQRYLPQGNEVDKKLKILKKANSSRRVSRPDGGA